MPTARRAGRRARCRSSACTCRPRPAASPGGDGSFHRPSLSCHDRPPSSLLNSAAGATPAHSTPSSTPLRMHPDPLDRGPRRPPGTPAPRPASHSPSGIVGEVDLGPVVAVGDRREVPAGPSGRAWRTRRRVPLELPAPAMLHRARPAGRAGRTGPSGSRPGARPARPGRPLGLGRGSVSTSVMVMALLPRCGGSPAGSSSSARPRRRSRAGRGAVAVADGSSRPRALAVQEDPHVLADAALLVEDPAGRRGYPASSRRMASPTVAPSTASSGLPASSRSGRRELDHGHRAESSHGPARRPSARCGTLNRGGTPAGRPRPPRWGRRAPEQLGQPPRHPVQPLAVPGLDGLTDPPRPHRPGTAWAHPDPERARQRVGRRSGIDANAGRTRRRTRPASSGGSWPMPMIRPG